MAFYARTQQLKALHTCFSRKKVQAVLVYGRRRVGKSELIKQALQSEKNVGIYFECKQTTEKNNVESLSVLLSEILSLPPLGFHDMEALLTYLFKRAAEQDMILVLDEYPYLRETVKGLDSILQALLDRFREGSRLKLVLCGSFVDVMKSLLLRENPLYGRVDLTIDLKPMDYYESALFYPDFSEEDKVRLYSVFGGIPYYNRFIDPSLSVRDNIMELVASPGARLENEVSLYLRSEISRINNANETFTALSQGYSRFSDILSQSHISSSPTLVDVLEHLIRMGLVCREVPINDEKNKRKAGYYISDNLSLFWYRYCFRYASQMQVLNPNLFFERYIAPEFESRYVPKAFEQICRQYLIRMNRQGKTGVPFDKIGKYYYNDPVAHNNGEFDIVTEDPKGYIFYEATFRKEPVTDSMIRQEIEQVKKTGLNCYRYGFISRSGFEAASSDTWILIDLKNLYE